MDIIRRSCCFCIAKTWRNNIYTCVKVKIYYSKKSSISRTFLSGTHLIFTKTTCFSRTIPFLFSNIGFLFLFFLFQELEVNQEESLKIDRSSPVSAKIHSYLSTREKRHLMLSVRSIWVTKTVISRFDWDVQAMLRQVWTVYHSL